MAGHVGQCLAQHGEHVAGQLCRDSFVKAGTQPHRRCEAEHRGHLVGDRDDVRTQALGPVFHAGGLQGEDRRPDIPDGVVQRVDRTQDPGGSFPPGEDGHGPLECHAGRIQPLDDLVVQVAGDPVPVGIQR